MNTVPQIREFFSTDAKPVKAGEMMEFWKSCTDEQKDYYKNADLSK